MRTVPTIRPPGRELVQRGRIVESAIVGTSQQAEMRKATEFADRDCPFTPGFGDTPPYLAGREREQRLISRVISRLKSRAPASSAILIYGPRGNGKTVLLNWTARLARKHGIKAVDLSAISGETGESLTRRLATDSWWAVALRAVSRQRPKLSLESLRANTVHESLGSLVRRRPAVVLIDEAQTLAPAIGERILKSTQALNSSGSALLLVLAGTPDLPRNLHRMKSNFWERGDTLPLMRLDRNATSDAIRVPLEAAGRRISKDALERLVDESHGYPYFVQLWGRTLWDEAPRAARSLGIDDVDRARPLFEQARNRLYSSKLDELRDEGLVGFAAALTDSYRDSEVLSIAEINRVLGRVLEEQGTARTESTVAAVRTRLHDLGYIWSSGNEDVPSYGSGIPSLMSYVSEAAGA